MPNTFSVSLILLILFPRVVAGSNPGLEFANAFGVFEKQLVAALLRCVSVVNYFLDTTTTETQRAGFD